MTPKLPDPQRDEMGDEQDTRKGEAETSAAPTPAAFAEAAAPSTMMAGAAASIGPTLVRSKLARRWQRRKGEATNGSVPAEAPDGESHQAPGHGSQPDQHLAQLAKERSPDALSEREKEVPTANRSEQKSERPGAEPRTDGRPGAREPEAPAKRPASDGDGAKAGSKSEHPATSGAGRGDAKAVPASGGDAARGEPLRASAQPAVALVGALGQAPIARLPLAVRTTAEGIDAIGKQIEGAMGEQVARRPAEPSKPTNDRVPPKLPEPPPPSRPAPSTVEHAAIAGGETSRAAAEKGSVAPTPLAGPRTSVPLSGPADPARIDVAHHDGRRIVDGEVRSADRATLGNHPLDGIRPRPSADELPVPRLPPIAGPQLPGHETIEVPPEQASQAQSLLGPKLREKATTAASKAQAAVDHTRAGVEAYQRRRDDDARKTAQLQDGARRAGEHRADGLRVEWRQAHAQVHTEHVAHVEARRQEVVKTAQTTVQAGEQEADRMLADTERDTSRHLGEAHARADAARAAASHKAAGGHHADAGDGGAANILATAEALVEQMVTAAHQHNAAKVAQLQASIAGILSAHQKELHDAVTAMLSTFPKIADFYNQELDRLFQLTQTDVDALTSTEQTHNRLATDEVMAGLAHDLTQLKGSFDEITTISNMSIEQLRAAFGVSFTDANLPNGQASKWTDGNKETALLGAIATEHAFRRSAVDGQMDGYGFGQGYQALFGKMDLVYNANPAYNDKVQQGKDGKWYVYDSKGNAETAGFASQADALKNRPVTDQYGGQTDDAHHIEFFDAAFKAGDSDYHFLEDNVIHEFGHAFNANMHDQGKLDLDHEKIRAMVNGKMTDIAGGNTPRNIGESGGWSQPKLPHHKPWYPDQQDIADDHEEEFADMFLGWVQDSFAKNDAGSARFNWMDRHMWGDTNERGVAGEQAWGWADTATDNNSGSSKWVDDPYSDPKYKNKAVGEYQVQPGDTLDSIAARLGVDAKTIAKANKMGDSQDVSDFPVLVIPGLSDAQIKRKLSG